MKTPTLEKLVERIAIGFTEEAVGLSRSEWDPTVAETVLPRYRVYASHILLGTHDGALADALGEIIFMMAEGWKEAAEEVIPGPYGSEETADVARGLMIAAATEVMDLVLKAFEGFEAEAEALAARSGGDPGGAGDACLVLMLGNHSLN